MTPADVHALKVAALNLSASVRGAESLPLLSRAAVAAKAAADQAALNLRFVGAIEFILMRLACLETESGGASTNEVKGNGKRGQGSG